MRAKKTSITPNRNIPAENDIFSMDGGYQKLFEHSPHGICILTPTGQIYRTNPKLCNMLGYEEHELENQYLSNIVHSEDKAHSFLNLQKLLHQHSNTVTQTNRYVKKDGSHIWVEVISSVISDSTGQIQYIIETIEDITERRISDLTRKIVYNISNAVGTSDSLVDLIKTIKSQLATLIDTTNFYVAIYNKENHEFSLPYYSDKFDDEEYESFPAEKSISNYVYKTKQPLLATPPILKELENQNEIDLVGPDSKIWLGIPLIFKGDIFGVMAVQSYEDENAFSAVDLELLEHISQQISISIARKKSEEELQAALESAKEADRIKSAFLSTMSHELRTPLNAVIGFSEILISELEDESANNYAEIIHNSGNHLLELVEGLFDITLIESGTIKIKKERFILSDLLSNIDSLIEAEQTKMGIDNIEIQLNSLLPDNLEIYTDPTRLKQILINLLKNALKFTKQGRIDYGCDYLSENGKTCLIFHVRDTGIGIPEDKLDYIFESFNQIDSTHTRKHDGAGIGLSVAKQFAELLGGHISVKSKVDIGSEFIFTIECT